MRSKITSMPISELVEDLELYPRHQVDIAHVTTLALALQAGANLPPVVADAKSKCITDGWHRVRAYRRVVGEQAVIDVELVAYGTRASMLLDAVARNATHGRRLDKMDETRAVVMLEREGVDASKIAIALNVPEARVDKLRIKVATSAYGNVVPGTNVITLKRPVHHMVGARLTKEQTDVHKMLPGTSFLLIAKQLTRALNASMVDLSDKLLVEQLKALQEVLHRVL